MPIEMTFWFYQSYFIRQLADGKWINMWKCSYLVSLYFFYVSWSLELFSDQWFPEILKNCQKVYDKHVNSKTLRSLHHNVSISSSFDRSNAHKYISLKYVNQNGGWASEVAMKYVDLMWKRTKLIVSALIYLMLRLHYLLIILDIEQMQLFTIQKYTNVIKAIFRDNDEWCTMVYNENHSPNGLCLN